MSFARRPRAGTAVAADVFKGPTAPAPTTNVARYRCHRGITNLLISTAIALGSGVGGTATASADPNPFGTLGCSCRDMAPVGGPVVGEETDRGIRDGLAFRLPAIPH